MTSLSVGCGKICRHVRHLQGVHHVADRAGWTLVDEASQTDWLSDLGLDDLLARARVEWDARAHIGDLQLYPGKLGRLHRVAQSVLVGVVHIKPDHLMPGVFQKHGRHGGVHPAGKAEYYPAHFLSPLSTYIISTDMSAGDTPDMRPA